MEPEVEFLQYVLASLVEEPDKIGIERTTDELGVLLTVKCAPSDMGKIIGRQGATAKAIRTVLRVVGQRQGLRVNMKIAEPEGSGREFNKQRTAEAFAGIA